MVSEANRRGGKTLTPQGEGAYLTKADEQNSQGVIMNLIEQVTYSVEEVAQLLSMKVALIQRYIKAGELEIIWRDGSRRITHD